MQDLVKLLLSESLQVVESLNKALGEKIRKINPIAVAEKKKIKHQYRNYWKKLELRRIKKSEKIKVKRKPSESEGNSCTTKTKTWKQAIGSEQEPQLMILK